MLLFGRFMLVLSLAVYTEYHKVNFHGLVPHEATIQLPTEQRTGSMG